MFNLALLSDKHHTKKLSTFKISASQISATGFYSHKDCGSDEVTDLMSKICCYFFSNKMLRINVVAYKILLINVKNI